VVAAAQEARPEGHVMAKLNGALKHVTAARVGELWPLVFSPGGRRWVLANVRDGVLDEAAVQLALDLDPAAHVANVLNARGNLRYHDVTINFFNGLPQVRKVSGTASFADQPLRVVPARAPIQGV